MRTPKISKKRALGLTLAAALAIGATVSIGGSSQAVTTPAATLTPATGSTAGGTVITVKGKGFTDSTGAVQVLAVSFQASSTCPTTVPADTASPTLFNVISATKLTVTTPSTGPSATAGAYYLCLFDKTYAGTSATALGVGKYTTGVAPTLAATHGGVLPQTAGVSKASVLGGTTVSIVGTGFDKTSKVTVDGLAAKTTLVSATKLSAVLPANSAKTLVPVSVASQFGTVTSTTSGANQNTISWVPVVSVSPSFGDGTSGNVITLTGKGFNSYTFAATAAASSTATVIAAVPAPATLAVGAGAPANLCTNIVVESDTSLSCKLPAVDGAYVIELVTLDGASTPLVASTTTSSRSATYTASAF